MNLEQFSRIARRYVDKGITVQLYSPPGVGKSQVVEALVEQWSKDDGFEWGFGVAMLATYTPSDLLGYLVPADSEVTNHKGEKEHVRVSEFTMPPWMRSVDKKPLNAYRRGVLFLDEYDKADPDVKRASAELLLNGGVGDHQLHGGIGIITAANRKDDRSGSTKEFDFVINRRAEIHIQPDVAAWENWAYRNNVPALFVGFAKRNPGIVFEGKIPEKQGPFCTPRSFVRLSELLSGMEGADGYLTVGAEADEAMMLEMASGMIGDAAANAFVTWVKMRTEVPDFEDIIKDPEGAMIPAKPDAKAMVCYDMAFRMTAENCAAVVTYARRLPAEFQVTFGACAIKRDHRAISYAAFRTEFVKKNTALLNMIAA